MFQKNPVGASKMIFPFPLEAMERRPEKLIEHRKVNEKAHARNHVIGKRHEIANKNPPVLKKIRAQPFRKSEHLKGRLRRVEISGLDDRVINVHSKRIGGLFGRETGVELVIDVKDFFSDLSLFSQNGKQPFRDFPVNGGLKRPP